jgi:hypothetical protein
MAVLDSILTLLRDRRAVRKQDQAEVSSFLRKIAGCCEEFRKLLLTIQLENKTEDVKASFARLDDLKTEVHLVAEYLSHLESVLGGRVKSEILDDVAVTLSRIITVEVPLVDAECSSIIRRFKASWHQYQPFAIVLMDGHLKDGRYQLVPVQMRPYAPYDYFMGAAEAQIYKIASDTFGNNPPSPQLEAAKSQFITDELAKLLQPSENRSIPTFEAFECELTILYARLRALADVIEAGANM